MEELSQNRIPSSALLKIALPAPFGICDQTIVDTSVRKAFEIPADALDLTNPSATDIGILFDLVLDRASEFLTEADETTGMLEINRILQDFLVDPLTGDYSVESLGDFLSRDS